jgi:thiol-disulfide isomerase/thioredoxin
MKLPIETGRISRKSYLVPLFFIFSLCFTLPLFALPINAPAPKFILENLDGKRISLSDYQGKMILLKLGTTWCPGCRDQDKELQKIDDLIKETGITLIQVFLDDPVEEVRGYQREYPMKSPVVTLLGNERLLRDYAVHAIPRLIILSAEQKVLSDTTGMQAEKIKARILLK